MSRAVKKEMSSDKKSAEAAAQRWRNDAHKLAAIASQKAKEAKKKISMAKERAKKKMKADLERLKKRKAPDESAARALQAQADKARKNAHLSRMVTATFSKKPASGKGKKKAKKATKKAKKAKKKAAGLLKRAAEQASKESAQKAKAKSASNDALKRALAHR